MNATLFLFLALLFMQAVPEGAVLEGSLVKIGTGEPIRGRVLLTKVEGGLGDSRTAVAGDNGKFAIRTIPAGSYRLFADGEGYVRAEYGQRRLNQPGLPIALAPGQEMNNVVVTMTPTSVIVGRVLNRSGDLLPNVYVRALKPAYRQGERILTSVGQTQTNDLGEYRLHTLPPGLYFISVAPYDPPRIEGQTYVVPTPPCLDCRGEGQALTALGRLLATGDFIDPIAVEGAVPLPVYFPGTADPSAARPIDLEPGTTFNAGDLIALRTRGVNVRGRVVNYLTGQTVTGASIQLDTRPADERLGVIANGSTGSQQTRRL
jgi:hypothetical protein